MCKSEKWCVWRRRRNVAASQISVVVIRLRMSTTRVHEQFHQSIFLATCLFEPVLTRLNIDPTRTEAMCATHWTTAAARCARLRNRSCTTTSTKGRTRRRSESCFKWTVYEYAKSGQSHGSEQRRCGWPTRAREALLLAGRGDTMQTGTLVIETAVVRDGSRKLPRRCRINQRRAVDII